MKIDVIRESPFPPPPKEFVLTLSKQEAVALAAIVGTLNTEDAVKMINRCFFSSQGAEVIAKGITSFRSLQNIYFSVNQAFGA